MARTRSVRFDGERRRRACRACARVVRSRRRRDAARVAQAARRASRSRAFREARRHQQRAIRFSRDRHAAAGARSAGDPRFLLAGRAYRRAHRRRQEAGRGARRSRPANHDFVDLAVVSRAGADRRSRAGKRDALRVFAARGRSVLAVGMGRREERIAQSAAGAPLSRREDLPVRSAHRSAHARSEAVGSPSKAARRSRWASSTCRARGAIRRRSSTT